MTDIAQSGKLTSDSSSRSIAKVPHSVIVRAPGLLPMLYRPAELAQDLGIPESTLRDWLRQGAPHQRDERGHIWINGQEFAEWVKRSRRTPAKSKMGQGEAYCFHCQHPVRLQDPSATIRGKQVLLNGSCPDCGSKVFRGERDGQSK